MLIKNSNDAKPGGTVINHSSLEGRYMKKPLDLKMPNDRKEGIRLINILDMELAKAIAVQDKWKRHKEIAWILKSASSILQATLKDISFDRSNTEKREAARFISVWIATHKKYLNS